jgi:hypothetical protein
MTSPDGLNLDEVADMLCDLLSASGYRSNREDSLPLVIGNEPISWAYPSIIICSVAEVRIAIICRFGPTATVPGYLTKYLDAARKASPDVSLYLACRTGLIGPYKKLCQFYGLGLVTYSLDNHRLSFVSEPTNVDIASVFDAKVSEVIENARVKARNRSRDIAARAQRYKTHAEANGLADRADDFRSEIEVETRRLEELEGRADELRRSKNLEDLEELRSSIADEA